MKHIHKKSGQEFEIGRLISPQGGDYDITVITYWKDAEQELIGSPVVLVNFYFGDYDEESTDRFIDMWLDNRAKEISVLQASNHYLDAYLTTNRDVLEAPEIDRLEQAIVECQGLIYDRSWKFEFKPVNEHKKTRSEYLRQLEELYAEDKIDDDAMDALVALACNYPEE